MPRARNLKHDFFMDDELAELEPLARILFAGLWCLADYKGDIEWRKAKVKAQTLPYDDCDIEALAINLDKSGFIRFYSDGNKLYVNVRSFLDHQHPHKNEREKGSTIPEYSEKMRQVVDINTLKINLDKSGFKPLQDGIDPADSLNPIPDSLNPIPEPKPVWHAEQREMISDAYNLAIGNSSKPKFSKWSDDRIAKLKTRCTEDGSRDLQWWLNCVASISNQVAAMEGDWFTLDWLLKSEGNLLKFVEGKFKKSFNRIGGAGMNNGRTTAEVVEAFVNGDY